MTSGGPRNGPDDHRAFQEVPKTCGNAPGASSREAFMRSLQKNLGQWSTRSGGIHIWDQKGRQRGH
eukprot:1264942-Pyramimonas_sp.AAC.1